MARRLRLHAYPGAIVNRPFFPPDLDVVETAFDPDVVALATGSATPLTVYRRILRARLRFGWRPLIYAHFGEIHADPVANRDDIDCLFSFAPASGNNYQHERYWKSPHLADHIAGREALAPDALWACPKTRFCNFVYSNARVGDTAVREDFARALMRCGTVDCPGRVLTNMPRLEPNAPGNDRGALAKLEFLAGYRFTIAFENVSADHYLTEKILHALLAGSIPIYWGCPQVAEYYNPDCFVNCHDFASFEDVIERVLAIEGDLALREAYRRAPMLRSDSRIPAVHAALFDRHRALVAEALERRGAAESCVERWRGCAALVWRNLGFELDPRHRWAAWRLRLAGIGRLARRSAACLPVAADDRR